MTLEEKVEGHRILVSECVSYGQQPQLRYQRYLNW